MGAQKQVRARYIAALAGCLFLYFGVYFFVCHTWPQFKLWQATKDGIVVEAKLLSVDLYRGGSSSKASAEYEYMIDGRTYRGSNVSIHPHPDNFGSYQRDMYHRLKKAFDEGKPVNCYVSPSDHSVSVIDNRMRPARMGVNILFAIVFSLSGGAALLAAITGKVKPANEHLTKASSGSAGASR